MNTQISNKVDSLSFKLKIAICLVNMACLIQLLCFAMGYTPIVPLISKPIAPHLFTIVTEYTSYYFFGLSSWSLVSYCLSCLFFKVPSIVKFAYEVK